jgi:hypothetical protein
VKSAGELRSQAERYRWLARNIGDEQVKTALEMVAADLDKRVTGQAEPQSELGGRERALTAAH